MTIRNAQGSNTDLIGILAIIIGGMLLMGSLMFLLVAWMTRHLPTVALIPPIVQIGLALLCSTAGVLLKRGYAKAKFILLLVGIGVVANFVS